MSIIAPISVLCTIGAVTVLVFLLPHKGTLVTDRLECPGFKNKTECIQRGCLYDPIEIGPSCFLQKDEFGYVLTEISPKENGITAKLNSKTKQTPYGPTIPSVSVDVDYITENIVRVKLYDPSVSRYEVPVQKKFSLLRNRPSVDMNKLSYRVEFSRHLETFRYKVVRIDGTVLWDTDIGGLIMSDQFLQIASYVPSDFIFGLGEHNREHLKHDMNYTTYTMFSRDKHPERGGINLYGVHPFYTCLEKSSKSHGVLFLNSNAMEVTLMPAPGITFRTIGGVLDFFYFVGENPEHVIQLYTSLVGRPIMPPYWGLGFQLSRYGYMNLDNLTKAIERTREAMIPQDVQYLDIDHMEGNKDFTHDEESYTGLPEYMKVTQEKYGLKWITIIDPTIAAAENYEPYSSGVQNNVFIKRAPWWDTGIFPPKLRDKNITYGKVWPKEPVAFPDYFLEETKRWWVQLFVDYHKKFPFDGLWIDMNEPANFGTNGEDYEFCEWTNTPKNECWVLNCPMSLYDTPIYNPLERINVSALSSKTICMESRQGTDKEPYLHYNVHSLYGWSQSIPTLEAAEKSTGTRSLVIARSTYPSSGRYCGHWLGDNRSFWKDLHDSVIGIQEFSLFGIPYIGADVCGFFNDASPELCARWMQLGAFYTFYRNHNGKGFAEQDPAVFGKRVANISKKAVWRRYTLLPYLYTLFYRAHVDGSTVIRPVFHEFPFDKMTWNIDEQFMWGSCLLISPALREIENVVRTYLPKGEWWHFKYENSTLESGSEIYVLKSSKSFLPLHVRGGCILPTEDIQLRTPSKEEIRNITLYVYPSEFQASGELFIDDGISKDTIEEKQYDLYQFEHHDCVIEISREENTFYNGTQPILKQVVIFKIQLVTSVTIDSNDASFQYNKKTKVLTIDIYEEIKSVKVISWKNENSICNPQY